MRSELSLDIFPIATSIGLLLALNGQIDYVSFEQFSLSTRVFPRLGSN
jgi:hypothetical protein